VRLRALPIAVVLAVVVATFGVLEPAPPRRLASTTGDYVRVNGLEIYYEVHGSGRPLVLLHGAGMTIDLCWGAWLPELAETRRVVAIEMQGHGHTADIDRDFTLENLAGDVVGVLDHLGIDEADIFGFSMGGLVSLETALRYPDRVGRVVAASVAYRPDGYYPELFEMGTVSRRVPTQEDFKKMRAAHEAVAPFPEQFDQFLAKVGPLPRTHEWSAEELRSIRVPVLLIVGDTDIMRIDHVVEMSELIPDTWLAVLPETNHMEVVERGELVLPMVRRFLGN
jgi:pimeloyl-ACP methyl ester carboxylesterase